VFATDFAANYNTTADKWNVSVTHFGGTAGTFSGGRPEVNTTHLGALATSVANLNTVFNTDFASNYNTTADRWKVDVTHYSGTLMPASPAGVIPVDVTHWLNTSVPAAHTSGYPIVTIKDGTGTGEINTSNGTIVDVINVSDVQTVQDVGTVDEVTSVSPNGIDASAIADGAIDRATFAADTGLQSIRSGQAQSGSSTNITLDASASAVTDFYKNSYVLITGGSGAGQYRLITGYNGTSKAATVAPAWIATQEPTSSSTFAILPAGIANVEAWFGAPVASPTQPGVPEVDVTHVLGDPVCD
jgi:hypothetical protein